MRARRKGRWRELPCHPPIVSSGETGSIPYSVGNLIWITVLGFSGLHAPGEPEIFEQSTDSSGFLLDRVEPRLDPFDSSAEPKQESGHRDPAGEHRDELG